MVYIERAIARLGAFDTSYIAPVAGAIVVATLFLSIVV